MTPENEGEVAVEDRVERPRHLHRARDSHRVPIAAEPVCAITTDVFVDGGSEVPRSSLVELARRFLAGLFLPLLFVLGFLCRQFGLRAIRIVPPRLDLFV
jgi:hypothetical protein